MLAGVAALLACSTMQVTTVADPDYDFTRLRTYTWLERDQPRAEGHVLVENNPFLHETVVAAIDRELRKAGFTLVTRDENPDCVVDYHAVVEQKLHSTTYRTFHPVQGGGSTLESETTETFEYARGTLIVHVLKHSGRELWRGVAQDAVDEALVDPDVAKATVDEAMAAMFAKFPGRR